MRVNLLGQVFGNLEVIGYREGKWVCLCKCGRVVLRNTNLLRRETVFLKVCGKCKDPKETHGLSRHKLFDVWSGMKKRCYSKTHKAYKNYGGRGIAMHAEWLSDFQIFFDWAVKNGWEPGLSIDREDNSSDYTPCNCRWITMAEQTRNQRRNVLDFDTACVIKTMSMYGCTVQKMCEVTSVTPPNVRRVLRGDRWADASPIPL